MAKTMKPNGEGSNSEMTAKDVKRSVASILALDDKIVGLNEQKRAVVKQQKEIKARVEAAGFTRRAINRVLDDMRKETMSGEGAHEREADDRAYQELRELVGMQFTLDFDGDEDSPEEADGAAPAQASGEAQPEAGA